MQRGRDQNDEFLAHLSRRLEGELIVYGGIRRPSVRRLSYSIYIKGGGERKIVFFVPIG